MVKHYLEFEKPLIELEREIEHLKRFSKEKPRSISADQLNGIWKKNFIDLQKEIFSQPDTLANYPTWQDISIALNPPTMSNRCFEDFVELHGDRNYGDDPAIIGGIVSLTGDRSRSLPAPKGSRC